MSTSDQKTTIQDPGPRSAGYAGLLRGLARRAALLLAPPVCCLCGAPGQQDLGSIWGLDLCAPCEAACPRVAHPCPRCGLPLATASRCASCTVQPPPFDALWAAFAYAPPVDALIRELKFHGELPHARVLGMLLAARRRGPVSGPGAGATPDALPDAVVPVPLSPARFAGRGFNQATELGRHAARQLGLPLRDLLRRSRDTTAQSLLPARDRRTNLGGAFRAAGRPPPHVALVDDVMTTGSTAAEAARVLKAAGAARVEVWVVARAL